MTKNLDFKGTTPLPADAPTSEATALPTATAALNMGLPESKGPADDMPTQAVETTKQRKKTSAEMRQSELKEDMEASMRDTVLERIGASPRAPVENQEVSYFEGVGSAARMFISGASVVAVSRAVDSVVPDETPDMAFLISKKEAIADLGFSSAVAEITAQQTTNPAAHEMAVALGKAPNAQVFGYLLDKWEMHKEDERIQRDSSGLAFAQGLVLGFGADVAVTILGTGGLGLMGVGARNTIAVANVMQARKRAAKVTAAWGIADGAVSLAIEDFGETRIGITYRDWLLALGLGGFLGGALGAFAPRVVGNVLIASDYNKKVKELKKLHAEIAKEAEDSTPPHSKPFGADETDIDAAEQLANTSASAAENKSLSLQGDVSTTGFASPVGKRLNALWNGALRAPKSLYRDLVVHGESMAKNKHVAVRNVGVIVGQIFRTDMLTAGDRAGIKRRVNLDDRIKELETQVAAVDKAQRSVYTALMKDVFDQNVLMKAVNNAGRTLASGRLLNDANQPPTAQQFGTWADQIAQARGDLELDLENVARNVAQREKNALENKPLPKLQSPNEDTAKAAGEIEDFIRTQVGDDKFDDVMAAVEKAIKIDDDYYQMMGELEVKHGVLSASDLRKGYRPQHAVPEMIDSNRSEWEGILLKQFRGEMPDATWVNANYDEILDTEVPLLDGRTQLIGDNETFDDLIDRNPDLAMALVDQWDLARRGIIEDLRVENRSNIEQEFDRFVDQTATEVLDKYTKNSQKFIKTAAAHDRKLERLKAETDQIDFNNPTAQAVNLADINKLLDVRAKHLIEKQAHDDMHADLLDAISREDGWDADFDYTFSARFKEAAEREKELERFSAILLKYSKQVRKATTQRAKTKEGEPVGYQAGVNVKGANREFKADVGRINKSLEFGAAKATIVRTIEDMTKSIMEGKGMTVPGDLQGIGTSGHFKRRAINLAGIRHQPNVAKFFRNNSDLSRDLYAQSAGRQAHMQGQYGDWLESRGVEREKTGAHKHIPDQVTAELRKDFKSDRKELALRPLEKGFTEADRAAQMAELVDSEKFWMQYLEQTFGEYTRSDFVKNMNSGFDRGVSIAQTVTTTAVLGNIALAIVADIAIAAMAGGKLSVGLKGFLGGSGVSKAIADMAGVDGEFEMSLLGANAWGSATARSQYDLDASSLSANTGTLASKFQAGAQTVATAQGWANMMHPWNKWVRKVAGIGNAEHIIKTALKGLDDKDIPHFAKMGLDSEVLDAIADLARRFPMKSGKFQLTDISKWHTATVKYHGEEVSGKVLVAKFQRAITRASDEALLDPGLGDRPFMRATPQGRLFLTLSSFMYTAGQRYVSPLIQSGRIDPKAGRVYVSAIASLVLPIVMNDIRDMKNGKESTLATLKDADAGVWANVLKAGIMRSPATVGMSGMFSDVFTTMFGDEINSLAQFATGTEREILNVQNHRARGAPLGLLGPVINISAQAAGVAANLQGKPIDEAAFEVLKFTPIFNTILVTLALNKLSGDN